MVANGKTVNSKLTINVNKKSPPTAGTVSGTTQIKLLIKVANTDWHQWYFVYPILAKIGVKIKWHQ